MRRYTRTEPDPTDISVLEAAAEQISRKLGHGRAESFSEMPLA